MADIKDFFFYKEEEMSLKYPKMSFTMLSHGDLLNVTSFKIGWILIGCQRFYHPSNLSGSDPNGVETVASVIIILIPNIIYERP